MKSFIALTVAAFALASCGGSGGGGALGPTSQDIGFLPSGFVATYDGATDEVVLTIEGLEVARLANTGAFAPGFTRYTDGGDLAVYAETISGGGAVFIVASPVADLSLVGVQVVRLGETDLPSGGSATFNGNYAGVLVGMDLVPAGVIQGDAQLIANFTSASISGDITNRILDGILPADDIQLLPTAITSAGAFSGTTSGGDIGVATADDGTYVGLIVGATGNEVVGGVNVAHLAPGIFFLETGAFVAAQ